MRYAALLALLALTFGGCAVGTPTPPTGVGQTGATLHAGVVSNLNGPTEVWFSYGTGANPATWTETTHQTIDIQDRSSHPISASITGLSPGTTYNWTVCAQDSQRIKFCFQTQKFTTDGQREYVALGDSLTQVGSSRGSDGRYPERFFSFLKDAGAADLLSNVGISGERSSTLLNGAQLTNAKARINDPSTNTTVVTIDIGGNDLRLNSSCSPTSSSFSIVSCQRTIQSFATNLEAIFDELDTALGNDPGAEEFIAIEYFNPWSGRTGADTAAANARVALLGTDDTIDCDGTGTELGLNDVIACTAEDHGAKAADMLPPFNGHGNIGDYFFDEIHTNDAGHQVMADVLEDVFQTDAE